MHKDIFILDGGKEFGILYSPLTKAAALINESAAEAVLKHLNSEELTEDESILIDKLMECRFFDEPQEIFEPVSHCPNEVTLFPTSACNLRCRYCYANAGDSDRFMAADTALRAIDYVIDNAKKSGMDFFKLSFHGNGEPFSAFGLIKQATIYARDKAEENNLNVYISSATNGVLSDEALDFILAYFDGINLSFDVLPDIQNRQRPFADGSGSYDAVARSLKRLDAARFNYGIRVTVTESCVHLLTTIVKEVLEKFPNCTVLHIEPAWESGRCVITGEKTPEVETFISQFLEAMDLCKGTGTRLAYSGARAEVLNSTFCGAASGGFTVTAEGFVTSCYEVCKSDDQRFSKFVYGQFNSETGEFDFDEKKLEFLRRLTVKNMEFCGDCFCKWHCCGDCPAKLLPGVIPENHTGSLRCKITRAITLKQLYDMLEYDGC